MTALRSNVMLFYIFWVLLRTQTVPAYSTSRFRIQDLSIVSEKLSNCCESANSSCSCDVQLSFCAGVRFSDKKHYKDCHYIHFQTPFLSKGDFPYNVDVPISIRWPVTEWQLTVSGHDRSGKVLLEVSRFFQNISSHSPVVDMTIESENMTLSFSFSVECEANFYGPTCTVFCNETFKDQNGGSFKCSPDGKKLCESGWGGPLCNEPKCDPTCGHGTCTAPNTCRCDFGWKGLSCTECVPLAGCQHGSCRSAHQCVCDSNWGGILCDMDLDYCSNHADVCENGGTCIADITNSYKCICAEGFEGRNCERQVSKEGIDCAMLSCGEGVCVMKPTPRCEYPNGKTSDLSNRIDFLMVSVILLMVALCLAIISIVARLLCERLEVIHRMSQFGYSAHWVTAEVHLREPSRRYDKKVRSFSPPPGYDTDPGCSTWRSSTTHFVDEASV
ncbi:hypothetical protein V3C99_015620 [Haemonchus contortus]